MPVLLGTDVPQLQDFIGQAFFGESQPQGTEDVFAVTTRSQFLRQAEQEAMLDQADKLSGVVPIALNPRDQEISDIDDHTSETETQATINHTDRERITNREFQGIWMSELDNSLFEVNKTRPKLTWKQKHENCQKHKEVPGNLSSLTDISMEQLQTLQKVDATLVIEKIM